MNELVVNFTEGILDVTIDDDGLSVLLTEEQVLASFGEVVEITYSAIADYIHTQSIASINWTVNHNLGKYPSVTIVDSGGDFSFADITYADTNTLHIIFTAAVGGYAYLN